MPKYQASRLSYMSSMTNRNQGGGSKKQGLAPSVGTGNLSLWNGMRRASSTPAQRATIFCINQLGSVGPRVYQTRAPSDAVKYSPVCGKILLT